MARRISGVGRVTVSDRRSITGPGYVPGMADALAAELVALAERLALAAGALLLDGLRRPRTDVETKSSPTDMVTEMDRASEALIVGGINEARPGDAVVGEEGADVAGTTGVQWYVDPIDGTTNYLYGLPAFTVSIAAAVGDTTIAGVVHDPSHGETFTATSGGGAFCNGQPMRASALGELGHALVGTGYSYLPKIRAAQGATAAHVLPRVRDLRRYGSAALDLCWVGRGRYDAFYERGLQAWDREAGLLVAAESGAFTETEGGLIVACGPALAGAFTALLAEAGA
jgi:myo-inositol-1(or 4)-monophosphatase